MPFAVPWVDPETVILSKVRQRKTNIMWYHLYVESKKWYKWTLFTKQKYCYRCRKLVVTKEGSRGVINWEIGIDIHTLLLSYVSRVRLCATPQTAAQQAPVPGILQARILEWVAISFSSAWKWKVKAKSLSRVWLFTTPWTVAYQAPPSMGFSRQEYCFPVINHHCECSSLQWILWICLVHY